MAVYQPPDEVVIAIGAAHPAAPLAACARRLFDRAREDTEVLGRVGWTEEDLTTLRRQLRELDGMASDKRLLKNDTPPQMAGLLELMAEVRAWLKTLRLIAGMYLTADTPALLRLASSVPELSDPYPRDLASELELRLRAASDLEPRLFGPALDSAFIGRGRRLHRRLTTAIGAQDLDPKNLQLEVRRFYTRKGQLVLLCKRLERTGRLVFVHMPERAEAYQLSELEPVRVEAPRGALAPE